MQFLKKNVITHRIIVENFTITNYLEGELQLYPAGKIAEKAVRRRDF